MSAGTSNISQSYAVEPLWARLYQAYRVRVPNHWGKGRILRVLHRRGLNAQRPFLWRMSNGNYVAIAPAEGLAPWSVGWTCFDSGEWEPHIERLIRQQLQPGMIAMDIGANLGYFSAVMSQCVGPTGKVWSFEPVPSTYFQLQLCQSYNGFSQLTTFSQALGTGPGSVKMHYNPTMMGSASLYSYCTDGNGKSVDVPIDSLDNLYAVGKVSLPSLIKIDVEGHEYAVFAGAKSFLSAAKPKIIFEYNAAGSAAAGWTLVQLANLLQECVDYRFYQVTQSGFVPIDPFNFRIAPDEYVDLFAEP
jgi:FkbM family methyltransferase